MDSELSELSQTAEEIAASGADAVIVQDLAVMKLFLKRYPSIEVHASTQCAVHNTDGAKFFEDLGVNRVVLARELSIKEIEKIRSETNVTLEAFVHGALCMCLSGGCYMSGMLGGRSGNRGLCAQPCRLNFHSGKSDYALSLKDMSHLSHVHELLDAGVTSFKLEVTMKRPEYVAAAVTACRQALNGEKYDEDTLRAVFSRSGFTDGYATGQRNDMFGHREKDDVTAADKVLKDLQHLYEKETQTVPVSMALSIGDNSRLTATALGVTVKAESGEAIPAEKHPTDNDYAMRFMSKCGGTQFYLENLTTENEKGLMLPPSAMNGMRRQVLGELNETLGETKPHEEKPFEFEMPTYTPPENEELWVRFETYDQMFREDKIGRIILPIEELKFHPELIDKYGDMVTGEVPSVLFPENEEKVRSTVAELKSKGLKSLWAENAYGIYLAKCNNMDVYGGAELNIINTPALEYYRNIGLSAATVSFELAMNKISHLGGNLPRGYIAYGYLPLMRVRNCPNKASKGSCKGCDGRPHLTDRMGTDFPMVCGDKKYTTILNSLPLHIGGKQQARVDFKLMYYTVETKEQCKKAFYEIAADSDSSEPRTGGLYYRTLK
jgi:putative protease